MNNEQHEYDIKQTKALRRELDLNLQHLKGTNSDPDREHRTSRERSLAITKLQEAIMWLGMDLKDLGEKNPYPNSYNADNTTIEPTADNLKL